MGLRLFTSHSFHKLIRDRPFNLQRGGYGFLFPSEFFFRTTRELEHKILLPKVTLDQVEAYYFTLYMISLSQLVMAEI
jgi:hypothetical protein